MTPAIYALSGVTKSYGELEVLSSFSAEFKPSSVTAILGPSGAGKTTILNIMAGLLAPDSGTVSGFRDASFSYSFQEPRLLPWLSSFQNILFALSGYPDRELAEGRARRFMEQAGLMDFGNLKPAQLSGGMKRRLSLARAFAYPSDVLLMDEAFAAVDLKMRIELMDLFSLLWREEKRTTIMVTHEVHDALYLADSVILLSARPARALDVVHIDIPREERKFGSRDFLEAEARLYGQILA